MHNNPQNLPPSYIFYFDFRIHGNIETFLALSGDVQLRLVKIIHTFYNISLVIVNILIFAYAIQYDSASQIRFIAEGADAFEQSPEILLV